MQITWHTSSTATTLHMAAWMATGHTAVDRAAEAAIRPAVEAAATTLADGGLVGGPAKWLDRAAAQAAAGIEGAATIADRVLAVHRGTQATPNMRVALTAAVANLLSQGGRWLEDRKPSLADEIALRRGPLAEQWDARGRGLMRGVARLTEPVLVVESARVCLVLPAAGGHGVVHAPTNTVRLEALLANPHPRLPEVVRLGWLLGQLQADLPPLVEHVPAGRAESLMMLAMVPATLAAAEDVELASCDAATIGDSLKCWHVPHDSTTAEVLLRWWQTYSSSQAEWRVALAALGQMLAR